MIAKKVRVETAAPYDVIVGRSILGDVGRLAADIVRGDRAVIVCDSNTAPLYAKVVRDSLAREGIASEVFTFPAGEPSKTLATFSRLVEFLAEVGLTRSDFICALGGGVVGDLSGYAAASYLRGIDFIQIPTSLLAAVDSSVGGKCGVDLEAGKNLCGAFHQPRLVLFDADVLSTLPPREFSCGMAEVIKYGMIRDAELFSALAASGGTLAGDALLDTVAACVSIKADVVRLDEREGGLRRILNFGHTAAHAIEKLSGFAVSHGEAVAAGMVIAQRYAERCSIVCHAEVEALADLCRAFSLPASIGDCAAICNCDDSVFSPGELLRVAASDKKRVGDSLTVILSDHIGSVVQKSISLRDEGTAFFGKEGTPSFS